MALQNTSASYGSLARILHWLTALLVLTAIPLGLYANRLPYDFDIALAVKSQVFSIHNTVGLAIFSIALLRIGWALTQTRPVHLHPERRLETTLADVVYWTLYLSLVLVPLTGWITHAAYEDFAPILWPFGQHLPFVPISNGFGNAAGTLHYVFTKILIVSIILHFAGAMKHAIFDMDATMGRMTSGTVAAPDHPRPHAITPAMIAIAIYIAGFAVAVSLTLSGLMNH